jgi:hypothetical protein
MLGFKAYSAVTVTELRTGFSFQFWDVKENESEDTTFSKISF